MKVWILKLDHHYLFFPNKQNHINILKCKKGGAILFQIHIWQNESKLETKSYKQNQ